MSRPKSAVLATNLPIIIPARPQRRHKIPPFLFSRPFCKPQLRNNYCKTVTITLDSAVAVLWVPPLCFLQTANVYFPRRQVQPATSPSTPSHDAGWQEGHPQVLETTPSCTPKRFGRSEGRLHAFSRPAFLLSSPQLRQHTTRATHTKPDEKTPFARMGCSVESKRQQGCECIKFTTRRHEDRRSERNPRVYHRSPSGASPSLSEATQGR